MAEEKKKQEEQKNQETQQGTKLSETWAQDALGDLEDLSLIHISEPTRP